MTRDEAAVAVRRCLGQVVPAAEVAAIGDDALLHEALHLDSLDVVQLVIALQAATGIDLRPRDYPVLASVGTLSRHVASHTR